MNNNTTPILKKDWPHLVIEALFLRAKGNYGFREYFLNILNYLIENRDSLHYSQITIVTGDRAKDVLPSLSLTHDFNVVTLPIEKPYQVYWWQNRLAKHFQLKHDDVIMFTSDVAAIVKSCKHLLVVHDWLYLRKEYVPSKLFRLQRRLFVPRGARLADKIITISEWVKEDVLKHSDFKEDKVVPIYNFLDFDKYSKGDVSQEMSNFCNTNHFFLAVSSGAPHKNLITLLKAYKDYHDSTWSEKKKLILVGSFREIAKDYFEQQSELFKKDVIQMRNISNCDLGYLYENASAFISTTLFEGFGMPIAEAMFFNIPVVVSNIDVVREITDNRAIYFCPTDEKELSNIMKNIGDYHPDQNARKVMIEKYSKSNTVAKYLEVINSMNDISID